MGALRLFVLPVLVILLLAGVEGKHRCKDARDQCLLDPSTANATLVASKCDTGDDSKPVQPGHCVCDGVDDDGWYFDKKEEKNYCFRKTGASCNPRTVEVCDDGDSICDNDKSKGMGGKMTCQCKPGRTSRANDMGCELRNPFPVECETAKVCKVTNGMAPFSNKPVCENQKCGCSSLNVDWFFDKRGGEGNYKCFKKTGGTCSKNEECDGHSECTPAKNGKCACKKGYKPRDANYGCEKGNGNNLQVSLVLMAAMFLVNKMA